MPGLPAYLLVHTATPVREVEGDPAGDWIEGEPGDGPAPVSDESVACVLFLPNAPESVTDAQASWRPRTITRPTLLYNPVAGGGPGKDDEVAVLAPELAAWTGAEEARWQVDGIPQPFGPPGRVIGVMCTLKAVVD